MKHLRPLRLALCCLVVCLLAACGSGSTTATTTTKPSAQPSAAAPLNGTVTNVSAAANATLSTIVTGQAGRTLYRFDKDTINPSATNCAGPCAVTWPPALVAAGNVQVGAGIDQRVVGTITRPDGTQQLTIGGWPAYYFNKDKVAGDINGQGVSGTWFALTPTGQKAAAGGSTPATLSAVQSATLGTVVVDEDGFTMYRFDKDTASPSASNCTGACAKTWPPEIAGSGKISLVGIDPSLVGSVIRPDGTKQLTIGGWPIYGYSKDKAQGDVNGQGVGGVWSAIAPNGHKTVAGAVAQGTATPSPGPSSSGY